MFYVRKESEMYLECQDLPWQGGRRPPLLSHNACRHRSLPWSFCDPSNLLQWSVQRKRGLNRAFSQSSSACSHAPTPIPTRLFPAAEPSSERAGVLSISSRQKRAWGVVSRPAIFLATQRGSEISCLRGVFALTTYHISHDQG